MSPGTRKPPDSPDAPELANTLRGARDGLAFDATAPVPMLDPAELETGKGGRLGERYLLLRKLGEGGMGEVHLARDEVLGQEVALKLVRPELARHALATLRDEVLLAQKVTHPNVCRTYDLEEAGGRYVIKMEFVDGETLAQRLEAGPIPVPTALGYARAIAAGLEAAHAQGIVHRDLKPHNVMLERATGRVVLMDFGLARRVVTPGLATDEGSSGTPEYMAPEQARHGAVDARADLFSLGALLFHLLVGKVPFPDARELVVSGRGIVGPAPDARALAPEVPVWLARLVARLLEIDPARRPPTARAVTLALAGPSRRGLAIAAAATVTVLGVIAAQLYLAGLHGQRARGWQPHLAELPAWDENADLPSFSPDGDRIVYLSDRDGAWRIYVESIHPGADGAKPSRAITPGALVDGTALDPDLPHWARDGRRILFVGTKDAAYAVAADGSAPPEKLADQVGQIDDCGGGRLALVRLSPAGQHLVIRSSDGPERELLRLPSHETIVFLRCDPSGKQIVFTRSPVDSHKVQRSGAVSLLDVDSGAVRVLTDGKEEDRYPTYPTFAPDGRSVVFASSRGGPTNLWEVGVSGGAPIQLTSGAGPDLAPAISPDGRLAVFDSDDTAVPIFALALGGAPARRRIAPTLDDVATLLVAPDGRELIASVHSQGVRRIVAVPVAEGDERRIGEGDNPTLTVDGETIVYTVAVAGATRIVAVPRAGGDLRTLAEVPGRIAELRAGPDGTLHIGRTLDQADEAWRVPLAGGTVEREAPAPYALVVPAPRGGWRVALAASGGTVRVGHVIPPGRPVDDPAAHTVALRLVAWDHNGESFVYWDGAALHRFRVDDHADVKLALEKDLEGLAVSPDGATVYVSAAVGHVRRHLIDNFADRPRPR